MQLQLKKPQDKSLEVAVETEQVCRGGVGQFVTGVVPHHAVPGPRVQAGHTGQDERGSSWYPVTPGNPGRRVTQIRVTSCVFQYLTDVWKNDQTPPLHRGHCRICVKNSILVGELHVGLLHSMLFRTVLNTPRTYASASPCRNTSVALFVRLFLELINTMLIESRQDGSRMFQTNLLGTRP